MLKNSKRLEDIRLFVINIAANQNRIPLNRVTDKTIIPDIDILGIQAALEFSEVFSIGDISAQYTVADAIRFISKRNI